MPEAVIREPTREIAAPSLWSRLMVNRQWLGFWFMVPAAAFLILFLAYPLALGIAYSFTDARIGHPCGKDFFVAPFLKAHPEFGWQSKELGNLIAGPWTTFSKGERK